MFPKNLSLFKLDPKNQDAISEQLLASNTFTACTSMQVLSSGWTPVRDTLVHSSGDHMIMKFAVERKSVPASAIKLALAERVAELEKAQSFKPGKKATRELREAVVDELVGRALASRNTTLVWLDRARGTLGIDSSSKGTIDLILRALSKEGVLTNLLDEWPDAAWLGAAIEEPDELTDLTVDDYAQLVWPSGKVITYQKADLEGLNLADPDLQVAALALTWDRKVSFVLSPADRLTKLKLLDVNDDKVEEADRFDHEVAVMCLTLRALVDHLGACA